METAAAVGAFLAANSGAIGAVSGAVGAGAGIYSATRKPGGGGKGPTPVSSTEAVTATNTEDQRKAKQRSGLSILSRDYGTPSLGQSGLLGA